MNIKMSIIEVLPFEEMEQINGALKELGWECLIVDNGNFVFEKKMVE